MAFPTIDDCFALGGAKRGLLHEFDRLLRDSLVAAQRQARRLDAEDDSIGPACLTVMMSVVASAALAGAENPADITDEGFAAVARDALVWAKRVPRDRADARARWLWALYSSAASRPTRLGGGPAALFIEGESNPDPLSID